MTEKEHNITEGSGNVFADLGLPDAEELHTKTLLAAQINEILHTQHLTQQQAAAQLDLTQPKVSNLQHYKLKGFSVEKLMLILNKLNQDIVITVKPAQRNTPGIIRVVAT